ncbi:hypothetical protein A2229_01105 [Candidatus Peregrinibacteria bacterium RIFOXYA2_FULL_33_7]|nr:MAG: hypothetical protein A2229_01105 [Candidatus Peregrinibacteria bacterium RIFOXYA2_FULL_33_7]
MKDHLEYDEKLQTFLKDQNIDDAYQALKPQFDEIHEEFITDSLESKKAKEIDFSEYLDLFQEKKELNDSEKKLRNKIGETFNKAGEKWKKEKYPQYEWKKGSKIANGADILSCQDMLQFIKYKNPEDEKIKNYIDDTLKGFFTYFGGFNQNRANYYETKKEASTAVATRIVHENLPKFCDNVIQFKHIIKRKKDGTVEKTERKTEYLNAYQYLKNNNKITQIKDAETEKMIESTPIAEKIFDVYYFSSCLSQKQIEEYNRIIGHYNLLINLYNQAKRSEGKHLSANEKKYKDLPKFKTLYKQIGCGKKKDLFYTIKCDTEEEANKSRNEGKESHSVEEIINKAQEAINKYFKSNNDCENINTVPDFINYILTKENYEGVYWSKAAMNTISDKYFANYHDLQDRLKEAKVFQKADKKSEDDIKIPEAIELSGLFGVLDSLADWQTTLFKSSILSNEDKLKIITDSQTPSEALLKMIFNDIEKNMESFLKETNDIITLKKYKGNKEGTEKIKQWFDYTLAINRMLKYFLVKENKIKGNSLDTNISEALKTLIYSDDAEWFKWYDALRNYLTQKPQDEAKENKLKLNFDNPSLAGGWDVNKECSNFCVILKDKNEKKYLAIMKKGENTLFQKEWTEGRGKNLTKKSNPLFEINNCEILSKMEYDFWADVSKMIPKCSTQLKAVVNHFKQSDNEFIFPIGYKVTSGEKFREECKISKQDFELNNKVFNKNELSVTAMRYDLSSTQEKQYIKAFQKEYWELLFKQEKRDTKLTNNEIFNEWINFCNKKYSELLSWERKYKDALTNWINFCKYFLSKYPKTTLFNYSFKESENYNSLDEFYRDVDICSYKLNINTTINKSILDRLVEEGKLYLFEIKNQDSNDGKSIGHKNNLHTIYWNAIFENFDNRPKLNGEAEIFYRKAISKDKLGIVKGKKTKNGTEIIKNYRFSKEKFILHVPITLNFCSNNEYVNDIVNTKFYNFSNLHFLGIDRGEKHLAYYSLVNKNGEIVDQGTLNLPFTDKDGNQRSIKKEKYFYNKQEDKWEAKEVDCWNYNDLLDAMASNRDMARKNWQRIGTIKEAKNGYVSLVIRKIADLAVNNERPAFIVLEDLNTGFKRSRQKIDKSVYQKFELALAKKLNFLVDKNAKRDEIGSPTKALQLTPPVNNYGDIENKKQAGIMLYTRANYTSQTDPATGWRKTIYLKAGPEETTYKKDGKIKNKSVKDQIIETFTDIGFDGKDYYFEYDKGEFVDEKTGEIKPKKWRLYSGENGKSLDRFRGEREKDKYEWKIDKIDIVKILDDLFVNFDKNISLLKQLKEGVELTRNNEHGTGESLRFAINLIQQIRNTGNNERDNDFILSPVRDENGKHFDSREYWDKETKGEKISMPSSGDANGAFNIARKGIIMNAHILANSDSKDLSLFVSDEEWDLHLNNKTEWKKQLNIFSSRKAMAKRKK